MEAGFSYQEAPKNAQQLGYAEADPRSDVEGCDTLAKVLILSNVIMEGRLKREDVACQDITDITLPEIEKTKTGGKRWKLIGELSPKQGRISAQVHPVKLPLADPLAHVMGVTNAIIIDTNLLRSATIVGAGAGKKETGYAIFSNLLEIDRSSS